MMNKILLTLFLCTFVTLNVVGMELPPPPIVFVDSLIETFESDTSDAWILESNWLVGDAVDLSSAYFVPPEHGIVAMINDDLAGQGTILSGKLISPPIVRVPDENYLLTFAAYFIDGDYQGADERFGVQISTDQNSWLTMLIIDGANDWQNVSIVIPPIPDEDTIYIAFRYDDGGGWNYGAAVDDIAFRPVGDYSAGIVSTDQPLYTQRTLKQMMPLDWTFEISNFGNLSLTEIEAKIEVETPSGIETIEEIISEITFTGVNYFNFSYTPSEVGDYSFDISFSHPEIGEDFYESTSNFIVSETLLSRDDGSGESGLGFGFGDPNWYGYYGSRFELVATDTVTAITVRVANGSTIENSSINFTITAFDDSGLPVTEVYHSEPVFLEDELELGGMITHHLPEPVILSANNYVFAAGQDALQGIVGFSFDQDNISEEGFWLVSPVAGGGYPWANAANRETLMIQPHFKNPNISTAVREPILQEKVAIFPNPAHDWLSVDLPDLTAAAESLTIYNSEGKVMAFEKMETNTLLKLEVTDYAKGLYLMKIQTVDGIVITEFIKD